MRPKHTHSQMRQQTDVSGDLSTESNADTLSSSISAASVSLPQPIGGKSGAHPDAVMSLHRTVTSLRSTKIVRLPESASLFDCCRVMTENRVDAVLLTAEGNESLLKGIITDKDVVRITSISDEYAGLKASGIMTKTPTCATPDTTVQEALKMMVRGHFRHLPVVKDGKIAGLLDITKCLHDAILKMERLIHASSHLYSKLEQKYSEVGQIGFVNSHELVHALKEKMVPTLSTLISSTQQIPEISVQASVRDALKVMAQQKGCATLVTDGNRHVVGIFTAKDLVSRVITPKLDLASTMISKVMTQNPDCANMKTTILDALHLMHDGRFLHLPVMNEQGKVVGLVDVLQLTYRVVSQSEEQEATQPEASPVWERFLTTMVVPDEHDKLEDPYGRAHHDDEFVSGSSDHHMLPVDEPRIVQPELEVFSFKFKDFLGNVNRISCQASFSTLLQTVALRVQEPNPENIALRYLDEDGDNVLITNDSDLLEAINVAKSGNQRVLRITVAPAISAKSRGLITINSPSKEIDPSQSHHASSASAAPPVLDPSAIPKEPISTTEDDAQDQGSGMSYMLTALGAVGISAMAAILRAKQ
eukprot:TRINITY_DN5419_c0_g2_i2.p1 TRINITY_DN5419_c0_g2~~TRINITY_DN5419_c0_g2_i2.p1  ORF type:complete len:589 (+),score=124.53 TRINITY_DN5419_c0_g2_i2:195-1961(+)